MANMSYCRFQNTMMDFRDCLDIVGEAVDDGKTMEQFLAELSKEEQYAFQRMLTYCQDFIYNVEALEDTVDEEA